MPDETAEPSEVTKAYIAGIIDGEGCISITRMKTGLTIHVGVTMTNPSAIVLMKSIYGGPSVYITKRAPNHKPVHMWRVQARKAERLLRDIRPYLLVKAEQCDLALSFRDHMRTGGALSRGAYYDPTSERHLATIAFREAAKQRMHELNKRGTN